MKAIFQTVLLLIFLASLLATVFFLTLCIQDTKAEAHVQLIDTIASAYPWTQRYDIQGLVVCTLITLLAGGSLMVIRK